MRIEHWPAGYDYRPRFPELHEVLLAEGGVVYAASGPEGYAVISDESVLGEILGEADLECITIRFFENPEERDGCLARFQRGNS
ncbi:MAG TPA: hypothetical protein VFT57_09565 [Gemmatimonadaceae bacterium]|nr:hypothetical protein [Gemmatimonadaceae bacterium]